MKNLKISALIGCTWATSALACASGSIVGVWHGNIRYDLSKLPSTVSAKQKAYLANEVKRRANDKIALTFTKDNKFTMVVSGPVPQPPPIVGKWFQDGKTVQIQIVRSGNPDTPQALVLSKDGKDIVFKQPGSPATYHFWR